ncbi:hypothetical protein FB480_105180 [Agrobacterium vitis]|nr:hypothetical protein FB480_105180 [Agrobacterium vitis]
METSFEFLTTGKAGRGVQRHWPDEVKRLRLSSSHVRRALSLVLLLACRCSCLMSGGFPTW